MVSRTRVTQDSGMKAPDDVRRICLDLGMEAVDVDVNGSWMQKARGVLTGVTSLMATLRRTRRGDVLVVQYPLGFPADRLVNLARPRGRRVAIVHDVESLRREGPTEPDTRRLAGYDVVIAPTPAMVEWLRARLPDGPTLLPLEMYDYLLAGEVDLGEPAAGPRCLYFVGNLHPEKAGFLYSLPPTSVPVEVFGPQCRADLLPDQAIWRGTLDMQRPRLPAVDGYGLLWDGDSAEELGGPLGRYLRFNAPHKLSFYIAAGLPVVVPAESAVADLVLREGVGFTATSVREAAQEIRTAPADRWQDHCAAARRLRDTVVNGGHTRAALAAADVEPSGRR